MAMVILLLKAYLLFTIGLMVVYSLRHFVFTLNRLFGEQRLYYHDIIDSDLDTVSVLIPMHNEKKVAAHVIEQLLKTDYNMDKLEIIPINDFSQDGTKEILDVYAAQYSVVKPIHRYDGERGKPAALNEAIKKASGEVIIVFDADYLPPCGIIKDIAVCFKDPEVGAVMGRVVPVNTKTNLLTRLLDLERSGGYQVDQQARYNLGLMPQYGGTVGGFRRSVVAKLGYFNTKVLAEDTELTYRLSINGWKVLYANRAECYEEVPETWGVRARQIRRWSRGHNDVFFKYFLPVMKSPYLSLREKLDGMLLLIVYSVPVFLLLGLCCSLALFFFGEMQIVSGLGFLLFIGAYSTFGNFAPFYQVGTACFLDGTPQRILLLPLLIFNFFFNMWYISKGFADAVIDVITSRKTIWQKTERFRKGPVVKEYV
ncbi:glycosyltransferase family 2 protein [Sporomusa malonica]|uniref:Glycosyltransferase, catalytic subunit of cellulose synthase and poly-beta-1,6-N-acetylglucosamine synthase n=1 Tax=Sporomusa malonica TaxID=112901 RepID=A0A1W2DW42_9FIRM|nr:glycosyltransferase [Sporomusa malonica]SMD01653.1 Glycosyltransferase, catalytic subunit of cellulose synthase and poly-beta-1,6-N-acetylglucosamine synthase [Sporomusa malonica]